MSGDLISRQDAIAKFKKTCTYESIDKNGIKRGEIHSAMTYEKIIKIIESLPSAEPERKKGEWSNYKDEHCCSVCKCVVISDCWDDEIRYDYCPYCGAEME